MTDDPKSDAQTPGESPPGESLPGDADSMSPAQQAQKRTTLGIIFLTLFIDLVGFSIIFPLFPAMLDHYLGREAPDSLFGEFYRTLIRWTGDDASGQSKWLVQALFGGILGSLYSLLQFVASPMWGRLSDRWGRRPVLIITVGGLALSYLGWMLSATFVGLVVSRVLSGIMSGNLATATAAVADITPPKDRAKGMGIVGAAFGLGFVVGPGIGGALSFVDLSSWGSMWHPFSAAAAGALLLSTINLVWIITHFKETRRPEDAPVVQTSVNPFRLFGGQFGSAVRNTNLSNFLFILAFSGMEFTLTFLVRQRFEWGPGGLAGVFIYAGLILALVQGGVVRRVAPRYGEKRVAIVGQVLIMPGLILLAIAQSIPVLFAGLTLMSIGSALTIPTLSSLVSLHTSKTQQGAALGRFRSAGALARAIGPLLAGWTYWRFGASVPYLAGAALLILPVWILTRVPPADRS